MRGNRRGAAAGSDRADRPRRALKHLMEHLILRKQTQVDFLNRSIA
jgi:hypothetical protein